MSHRPTTPNEQLGIGLMLAGSGAYFMLVGLSVLPPPRGRYLDGLLWLPACLGFAFVVAGGAFLLRRFGAIGDE
jgi:hypothetical protein